MSYSVNFTAPIVPVTFKRPDGRGRRFNPKDYADFKKQLGYLALKEMRGQAPLGGAIRLYAEVFTRYDPTALNSGDWDNHGKSISDALNRICYLDDRQIIDGHVRLFRGEPHINILLEEV